MSEPIIVDVETYWDTNFSLRKMNSTLYNSDPRSRPYSISITEVSGHSEVVWLDKIEQALRDYHYEESAVLAYNARFDLQNIAMHFNLRPRYGVCLMDLMSYRYPLYRRHISLDYVAKALKFPVLKLSGQGSAGNLSGVTGQQVYDLHKESAEAYVRQDGEVARLLFRHLASDFSTPVPACQWFYMSWAIRQFIDPCLVLDAPVLEEEIASIEAYRAEALTKCPLSETELRSNVVLMDHLERLGVAVPMKASPSNPNKLNPEFAKTDPFMIHGRTIAGPAGNAIRARLICNSSTNITRARQYLAVSKRTPYWPIHLVASGAKTHRPTGGDGGGGNPLNLMSKAPIRRAICAPAGYRLVGYDYSKFELGIARWMAHDEPTKIKINTGADPYVDFAASAFGTTPDQLDENDIRRQLGKIAELLCQYGGGANPLFSAARSAGASISLEDCQRIVSIFRHVEHPALKQAWNEAFSLLMGNWTGRPHFLNVPGDPVHKEGWQWPSGRVLVMRNMRYIDQEAVCLNGYPFENTPDRMYGPRVFQRLCQSLANEIIQEKKQALATAGIRCAMDVYDELVLVIRERDDYTDVLAEIHEIATRPVTWWDNAPELKIGKLSPVHNYLECK